MHCPECGTDFEIKGQKDGRKRMNKWVVITPTVMLIVSIGILVIISMFAMQSKFSIASKDNISLAAGLALASVLASIFAIGLCICGISCFNRGKEPDCNYNEGARTCLAFTIIVSIGTVVTLSISSFWVWHVIFLG